MAKYYKNTDGSFVLDGKPLATNAEIQTLRDLYKDRYVATHCTPLVEKVSDQYRYIRRTYADDVKFDGVLAVDKTAADLVVLRSYAGSPPAHPQGVFMIPSRGCSIRNVSSYPRMAQKECASMIVCDLNKVLRNTMKLFLIKKIDSVFDAEVHIVVATRAATIEWCEFQMLYRPNQHIVEIPLEANDYINKSAADGSWIVVENSSRTINLFIDHEISLSKELCIDYSLGTIFDCTTPMNECNSLLAWTTVSTLLVFSVTMRIRPQHRGGLFEIVDYKVMDMNNYEWIFDEDLGDIDYFSYELDELFDNDVNCHRGDFVETQASADMINYTLSAQLFTNNKDQKVLPDGKKVPKRLDEVIRKLIRSKARSLKLKDMRDFSISIAEPESFEEADLYARIDLTHKPNRNNGGGAIVEAKLEKDPQRQDGSEGEQQSEDDGATAAAQGPVIITGYKPGAKDLNQSGADLLLVQSPSRDSGECGCNLCTDC